MGTATKSELERKDARFTYLRLIWQMGGVFNAVIEHRPGLLTREEYESRCALCSSGQVLGLIQSPHYQKFLLKHQDSSRPQNKREATSSFLSAWLSVAVSASVVVCVVLAVILFNEPLLGSLAAWFPMERSEKAFSLSYGSMGRRHGKSSEQWAAGSQKTPVVGISNTASMVNKVVTNRCKHASTTSYRQRQCFDRDEELTLLWMENQALVATNVRLRKTIDISQKILWMMLLPLSVIGLCIVFLSIYRAGLAQNNQMSMVPRLRRRALQDEQYRDNGPSGPLDDRPHEFHQQLDDVAEETSDAQQQAAELEMFLTIRERLQNLWCLDSQNLEFQQYLVDMPLSILIKESKKLLDDGTLANAIPAQEIHKMNGNVAGEDEKMIEDQQEG